MAVQYTTTDFLNSVRLRGNIPQTTNTSNVNNTTNLLLLATDELLIKLLPLILSAREEFYVTSTSYAITANVSAYALPSRASGQIIRDVHVITGNGIYALPPIEPEFITTTSVGTPERYYWENNNIVLYPMPSTTADTLRVRYFRRPSQLESTANCGQISAITALTNTITVSALPSTWAVGTVIDFVRATPPYDNQAVDQVITGISGTDITFASLPSDIALNDWVAVAEYSPIPQIPREFQPVLAQMTAVKVLQAQGDDKGAAMASKDLDILLKNALLLITQRNEGANHKVISRNWNRR